ncbi:hypothetical protein ebA3200 [Aromatoleum aromaticum EbN1]|uniref:Uncharacterized protein n=1 Tax=Aromatoleum aromaticum (strain DSM 19018 / LMG 30748 / EbN1) TaxID=76114 RepID=Q5P435_AROAE|nr:hypothetical protein ebA3200 [Aromatoleum aromaticum EbN1]
MGKSARIQDDTQRSKNRDLLASTVSGRATCRAPRITRGLQ